MTYRKWILAALAASVVAAGAFASGGKEQEDDWYGYGPGGMKPGYGRMGNRDADRDDWQADRDAAFEDYRADLLEDAEVWEGTFTMVDGAYPALVDADGETWYLMVPGMMGGRGGVGFADEDLVPEEGADIRVTALAGPMSPVHLMVLEAEVDGEALDLPGPGSRGGMYGGPGGGRMPRGRFDSRAPRGWCW